MCLKLPVCFLLLYVVCFGDSLQCLDENNNEVDWYVLYKIPHRKKGADNKLIKKGDAYLYITSNNLTKWQLSGLSVNHSDSFLARTLEPLYDQTKNSELLHILYNDEPPNKKDNKKKGHTKGILVGNEDGGFWIVHSVPLFPPASTEKYAYPLTGTVYGQSVLCMSFDVENLDKVGVQLKYNQPQIYSSNSPDKLSVKYPNLTEVINHDTETSPPWYNVMTLESRNGTKFVSFAKTRQFLKDLYEDWVAPTLKTDLLVETWLNGPGKLPSNCSKTFSTKNVISIKLDAAKFTYKSALDHSKWAVSNTTGTNWICIGDINRATRTLHRATNRTSNRAENGYLVLLDCTLNGKRLFPAFTKEATVAYIYLFNEENRENNTHREM